jgi:hypothetical protein
MAPGVKAQSAIAYEGPFGWRYNGDLVKSNKRIAVKEYKDETTVKTSELKRYPVPFHVTVLIREINFHVF